MLGLCNKKKVRVAMIEGENAIYGSGNNCVLYLNFFGGGLEKFPLLSLSK